MQLVEGTLIVSATDLIGYLACDHLATLELGRVEELWDRPPRREDPTVQLMQDRGDAHEQAHLERLRARGLVIAEIDQSNLKTPAELRDAQEATLAAMRAGADVVYQATFFDGRWRGHADFLYKRPDRPSPVLGGWSYDVADTKLSRGVKASAVIQMCVYADLLAGLQGVPPEFLHVVTGDGVEHAHRLEDYSAYYRHVKSRFEARVVAGIEGHPTYPDPVEHCQICVWYPTCIQRRRDDDHPSIVAGIRRVDTERLLEAGVATLTALAEIGDHRAIPEMNRRALSRLRHQARLQLHERRTRERIFELVPPDSEDPGKGLAALPEPSPHDLFLDIEADPWALDEGLEYLLGVGWAENGAPQYLPLWGHDRAGEKAAFERFMDLVSERLGENPELHLYHYGGYESGALKRLMQRHGTREEALDRLLRGEVLVDLLNVVRQGVRASVESYSLKQIEHFYMPKREGPVTEAGFSVVEYERWMREGQGSILDDIAAYNRDDVVSTIRLRRWLEDRRTEATTAFPAADWSRPRVTTGETPESVSTWLQEVAVRTEALTRGLPADRRSRTAEQQARWLLASLLDWHRRDDKPAWWTWHTLRTMPAEQLTEATEALGGLEYVDDVEQRKQSVVRRYRFEPQDHKFRVGQEPVDPAARGEGDMGEPAGQIVALDDVHGTIDLLRGPSRLHHHPTALIPGQPIPTTRQRQAMLAVADAVIAGGIDVSGPLRAVRDLLLRHPPRRKGVLTPGGSLEGTAESTLDAARRLGLELDGGVLAIQGPPGTGKTWTGARMIVNLVRAGRRVGVSSQSHKSITNMLREVAFAAGGTSIRTTQKCDTGEDARDVPGVVVANSNAAVADALATGTAQVAAGTAWMFSRSEFANLVDVLFVEEAGQLSLANVVAMGHAARSIVLLGDPNQLPQVSQGVHPEGAGASALEHLIGNAVTVPEGRGLFLATTRRMHPEITRFVSETFYEGRLDAHPSTALQRIDAADAAFDGAGTRWIPVDHEGNSSRSKEEAGLIADAIAGLLGQPWTGPDGSSRPLTLHDIIVVAPYNAQVAAIQAAVEDRLGTQANVGTVDKFQGQEGAIAIYSMASSSRDDAPRDLDFLYSRNRLNVAVSRARAIAVVVASPRLLEAVGRNPAQLRLLNALCRFVEVAEAHPPGGADGVQTLDLGLVPM